jgi:lysine biosynthesis protein LysW
MSGRGRIKTARCPECDGAIVFGTKMKLGKVIECRECGAMLEVISLSPLEFDFALEDEDSDEWEEDWEEEV